jgi:hypothetical protein
MSGHSELAAADPALAAWLRVTPRRLFSLAERAWQDVSGSSSAQ